MSSNESFSQTGQNVYNCNVAERDAELMFPQMPVAKMIFQAHIEVPLQVVRFA